MAGDQHLRQRAAGYKAPVIVRRKDRPLEEVALPRNPSVIRNGRERLGALQRRRVEKVEAGQGLSLQTQGAPVVLELLIDQLVGIGDVPKS